ncbi:MAG: hypothetical protein Kow0031_29190 [Anaerolineae bacterium]
MNNQNLATSSTSEEERTLGRRELLKALTAGGGAIAASAMLSGQWVKPVVEAGVLPAHAQGSLLVYFGNPPNPVTTTNSDTGTQGEVSPSGVSAILVVVNPATGIANVKANNYDKNTSLEINLNIDGTSSDSFSITEQCPDTGAKTPAAWQIVDYTLNDPSITIESLGKRNWLVSAPLGGGTLPPLECTSPD